jgi:hypothetical protein
MGLLIPTPIPTPILNEEGWVRGMAGDYWRKSARSVSAGFEWRFHHAE